MRQVRCHLLIASILLIWGSGAFAQVVEFDELYDDERREVVDEFGELLPPEPTGSHDSRTLPTATSTDAVNTTLPTPVPNVPPAATQGPGGTSTPLQPLPAPSARRQAYANQPYTLAGILDDEDKYIDCLCEKEFCERMWQCAGGRNQSWGNRLFQNLDLFGLRQQNRDTSMQCWQCSARQQMRQMQGAGFNQPYPSQYGGPWGGQPWQQGPNFVPGNTPTPSAFPGGPLPNVPVGDVGFPSTANVPPSLLPYMAIQ